MIMKDLVVEALRSIAEILTYGDQHDPSFFESVFSLSNTLNFLLADCFYYYSRFVAQIFYGEASHGRVCTYTEG